jgi:hypothetical protein
MAFPRSVRPAGEDAAPESAAFGDQAPHGAAAWRDSRPDSAPSSDAGPRRLPRNPPHEAPVGRATGTDDWAKSRPMVRDAPSSIRFCAPGATARGWRGRGLGWADENAPAGL